MTVAGDVVHVSCMGRHLPDRSGRGLGWARKDRSMVAEF